jgi:hypothetical protein
MAQCSDKRCKSKVEAGWSFCPYCGTDNRPATWRPPILACPHSFVGSEGFCIRCGECRDGHPTAAQRAVQAVIGRSFFILGFVAIAAAVAVVQIRDHGYQGSAWIKTWYDANYISWAEMGGAGSCGFGLLAMLIARLNGIKRKAR